ncbi:hypothetical protein SKAU_G00389400 [Synaphobranchus kaupii]|uniref:Uncharacterized protein n=1 Tax=Synaphobranchus kaupii TaxID=118154 RepID=A0A9Q1EB37_SYNKA|nr:hypothetical protein SKAU_G00389400 [Synaphobranchus kaupii]
MGEMDHQAATGPPKETENTVATPTAANCSKFRRVPRAAGRLNWVMTSSRLRVERPRPPFSSSPGMRECIEDSQDRAITVREEIEGKRIKPQNTVLRNRRPGSAATRAHVCVSISAETPSKSLTAGAVMGLTARADLFKRALFTPRIYQRQTVRRSPWAARRSRLISGQNRKAPVFKTLQKQRAGNAAGGARPRRVFHREG